MPTDPLVFAEDLRTDVDGVPACDGLTFRTHGDHVVVLGAPRVLFETLVGLRPVVRGSLRVRGTPVAVATRDGFVAGAPLDPPLPSKWTALEYVTWSARLAEQTGFQRSPRRSPQTRAKEAIARVRLEAMATQPLGRLVLHARRAVVLAAALATDARVIIVDDPLANLPEEIARTWASVVVDALADRGTVVLASRLSLTSPLVMNTTEAIIVAGSHVFAQGLPAELAEGGHRFVARIHGFTEPFAARLAQRGARMDVQGAQVVLDLGTAVTTAELLGLAGETGATVVELIPVLRALS